MSAADRTAPEETMRLERVSVTEVLDAIAAREPVPGGGAVSAIVAALGAALGRMVLSYSTGRRSLAEHAALHERSTQRLQELTRRTLELAAQDAAASARMIGLWSLAKDDPRRRAEWDDAVDGAIAAPRAILETSVEIIGTVEALVGRTNALLRSDLAIAAILAEAAARAAVWNIRVNLPQMADEHAANELRQRVESMTSDAVERCRAIEARLRE